MQPMAIAMTPDPALAQAVKALRLERDMTQEDVSHAAGMTIGAFGRLERAEVAPAWPTVRAVARALGVSMQELGKAVDRRG